MELKLATTRTFNGNELACYTEEHPQEKWDFWATREQIGKFLGYANPRKTIKIIHLRNQERLDKFSRGVQIQGGFKLNPPKAEHRRQRFTASRGFLRFAGSAHSPTPTRSSIFSGMSHTRSPAKGITFTPLFRHRLTR